MNWSAVRKQTLEHLAESLKGRVDIGVTQYRRKGVDLGRGWISFDREEIASVAAPPFWASIKGCDVRDPWVPEMDGRMGLGKAAGILLTLSIDEALQSGNPMVRGLAYLDRRCGKRRLASLREDDVFANLLLELRLFMEGVRVEPPVCPRCGRAVVPREARDGVNDRGHESRFSPRT